MNVVPKKGKSQWRLIIDFHIEPPKFSNEHINVISSIVQENDLFVTLDLKNGLYHVPIAEEHQTFLGFQWKKQYYCWEKAPFWTECFAILLCENIKACSYVLS